MNSEQSAFAAAMGGDAGFRRITLDTCVADADDDEFETDEWNVNEKVIQEMKESYRQVRRKDHKSPGPHVTISDSELPASAAPCRHLDCKNMPVSSNKMRIWTGNSIKYAMLISRM